MRVIVTGGSGQVGLKLQEMVKNNKDISFFFPSSKNFNLRNKDSIAANIKEFNPNIIVNLAAIVYRKKNKEETPFRMPLNIKNIPIPAIIGLISSAYFGYLLINKK